MMAPLPGIRTGKWLPIAFAPHGSGEVLCGHREWEVPVPCWWGVDVRGHEGGRWYEAGEAEWLEPQPSHWISLPPLPAEAPNGR